MNSQIHLSLNERERGTLDPDTVNHAVEQFGTHGALWISNVFDRGFVETLADAYHSQYTSQTSAQLRKRHAVVGDQRFMVTVTIEPPFNNPDLYANPLLMTILKKLLGYDCVISSFGSVVTFPGADDQPIHFDHPPLFENENQCIGLPPSAITLVIPLIDVEEETGSTAIWEGSHARVGARNELRALMENPTWNGSVHPLPKMGDVYLMDYRVIHGGMANKSKHARPILYLVFSRSWFRDAYNFSDQPPILFAPKEYKKIPKSLRRMFASKSKIKKQ
ncbi:MAG: phytanoyl-CoA dioxygenase family protein [Mariniblastus sp.]